MLNPDEALHYYVKHQNDNMHIRHFVAVYGMTDGVNEYLDLKKKSEMPAVAQASL